MKVYTIFDSYYGIRKKLEKIDYLVFSKNRFREANSTYRYIWIDQSSTEHWNAINRLQDLHCDYIKL